MQIPEDERPKISFSDEPTLRTERNLRGGGADDPYDLSDEAMAERERRARDAPGVPAKCEFCGFEGTYKPIHVPMVIVRDEAGNGREQAAAGEYWGVCPRCGRERFYASGVWRGFGEAVSAADLSAAEWESLRAVLARLQGGAPLADVESEIPEAARPLVDAARSTAGANWPTLLGVAATVAIGALTNYVNVNLSSRSEPASSPVEVRIVELSERDKDDLVRRTKLLFERELRAGARNENQRGAEPDVKKGEPERDVTERGEASSEREPDARP